MRNTYIPLSDQKVLIMIALIFIRIFDWWIELKIEKWTIHQLEWNAKGKGTPVVKKAVILSIAKDLLENRRFVAMHGMTRLLMTWCLKVSASFSFVREGTYRFWLISRSFKKNPSTLLNLSYTLINTIGFFEKYAKWILFNRWYWWAGPCE